MLPCKNDPAKKYKGDEPSPKGTGLCAHAEKVGTQKKGRDGRQWIVREDKNGTKTWKPVQAAPKKKSNVYDPEKYAYLDNGEWFLEYYKKVKPPPAQAQYLKALEAAWNADTKETPSMFAAVFGLESTRECPALPKAPSAAFAAYVSANAKAQLGKLVVETSEVHVGDPFYPKKRQTFPAPNGEWVVKSWTATTALIACAPGVDVRKLASWKLLSCHGRSFQGVADRVYTPDEVSIMMDALEIRVRGAHVIAEMASEMRGRVAMLGFKGKNVVCVVFPTMLNNL